MKTWLRIMIGIAVTCVRVALCYGEESNESDRSASRTIRVPADHASIQAAIDAADDGDTVLVAPGTYRETLRIAGKTLRLVSEYTLSGDEKLIRATILDGCTKSADGEAGVRDQLILVDDNVGLETEIVGFTIRNGDDGITNYARIHIAHNYFTANEDAIDNYGLHKWLWTGCSGKNGTPKFGDHTWAHGYWAYAWGHMAADDPEAFNNSNIEAKSEFQRTFRSDHPGGVHFVMLDGSVHFLTDASSGDVRRALVTRAGSETDHNLN